MTQEVTGISKTLLSYTVVIKNCKHSYANNLKIHFNSIIQCFLFSFHTNRITL